MTPVTFGLLCAIVAMVLCYAGLEIVARHVKLSATLVEKRGKTLVYRVVASLAGKQITEPTLWLIPCQMGLYSATQAISAKDGRAIGPTPEWSAVHNALSLDMVEGRI